MKERIPHTAKSDVRGQIVRCISEATTRRGVIHEHTQTRRTHERMHASNVCDAANDLMICFSV